MRQRLLVGMGAAIVALAAVLAALVVAGAPASAAHRASVPAQVRPAPAAGICVPAAQQCSPVVPHSSSGAAPAGVVAGMLVAVGLILPARARLRRRTHTAPLATGFGTTLVRPPQVGPGTF